MPRCGNVPTPGRAVGRRDATWRSRGIRRRLFTGKLGIDRPDTPGRSAMQRDRRKIMRRVVGQFAHDRRLRGKRGRYHEERVAVRLGRCDGFGRDLPAGAAAIFDHRRRTDQLGEFGATVRTTTSVDAPGVNGRITCIGEEGQSAAFALMVRRPSAIHRTGAESRANMRAVCQSRSVFIGSPLATGLHRPAPRLPLSAALLAFAFPPSTASCSIMVAIMIVADGGRETGRASRSSPRNPAANSILPRSPAGRGQDGPRTSRDAADDGAQETDQRRAPAPDQR